MANRIDTRDFDHKFPIAKRKILDHLKRDLEDAADEVLRRSSREVPFDIGTLKDSGKVEMKNNLEAEITYNTPYAARWHEEQANFQHGRKRYYLRDPLRTFAPAFARYINNKLRSLLG